MTRTETRQALAALALGVLSEEEARELEEGVAREPELAGELDRYRATVRTLERILPREPAPAHLFEAGRRMPRAWRLRSVGLRELALLALAAALVTALVAGVALRGEGPDADARAAFVPAEGQEARGEALLYDTGRADGRLVLRLRGVPALEDGHHYAVWLLRTGADEPDPVGVFSGSGEVEAEFRLPGRGRYAAVDVSVEEDGGDPGHSGRSLGAGTFA